MNQTRHNGRGEACFVASVAIILVATALAKVYSAGGSARILEANDPLFMVPTRAVLLLVAVLELGVAAFLAMSRSRDEKMLVVLWLTAVFIVYRFFLPWVAPGRPCPCLGTVAANLPLTPPTVDLLLKGVLAYFALGSALLLASARWRRPKRTPEPPPVNLIGET